MAARAVETVERSARPGAQPGGGVDHQQDQVGVLRPGPGGGDHRPVEPPLRLENAGRVDQQDLRVASIAMPISRARVVCALALTIATFWPTSALTSVDLPALGAPITATNPAREAGSFISSTDLPELVEGLSCSWTNG